MVVYKPLHVFLRRLCKVLFFLDEICALKIIDHLIVLLYLVEIVLLLDLQKPVIERVERIVQIPFVHFPFVFSQVVLTRTDMVPFELVLVHILEVQVLPSLTTSISVTIFLLRCIIISLILTDIAIGPFFLITIRAELGQRVREVFTSFV